MVGIGFASLLALLSTSTASPVARRGDNTLVKRYEPTIDHCVDGPPLDDPEQNPNVIPGSFYVMGLSDTSTTFWNCAEAFGVKNDDNPDGVGPAITNESVKCFQTTGTANNLGNQTACPGDPPPPKDKAGNDIAEGIIDAFCTAAGSEGPLGFASFAACFAWSFVGTGGDVAAEAEAGATLICDTFFVGICSAAEATSGEDLGGGGTG